MKTYTTILALVASFISLLSFSQGEYLIQIDPATGSYNKIGAAIAGIRWVYPNVKCYDETHGSYIFQGGDPDPDHLYSIDVTNGSIISNPFFSITGSTVRELKYDNTNDLLYGLYWDGAQFFLASVNPTNGLHTQIGTNPISGLGSTLQGVTAFDENHHRYFALESNQIFSIDAITGALISSPIMSLTADEHLLHFYYNTALDTLNGLIHNSLTQIYTLISINTTTGVITRIGSGTTFGNGDGTSTIDQLNQQYFYNYTTGGTATYLATMDIATGNLVSNNSIPISNGSNIHSISYDNIKNNLYGIQWENDSVSSITTINNPDEVIIYPVPTFDNIIIESSSVLGDITIVDYIGQVALQTKSDKKREQIDISNLASGVYILETQRKRYKIIRN
ncbi:MAG: hypothetical protein A2W93_11320 [Bacteroidetes bacterium GWF2_43_63]|nr:MAG: hypothetical protein A2W94_14195 [Bacteroidetes bacterium GWE2_42_42]OFY54863.1 MAG: hypothetical protein A2W93_11320 [Bacteroidetes bacterium GWF2_43_63]HCB63233.1 hypothetical protein [Bacteroidales bacterium]HCY21975.1 hypothetical protein [Bacteroidales bacterium]